MTEQTVSTLAKPKIGEVELRGKQKAIQKLAKTNFIIEY